MIERDKPFVSEAAPDARFGWLFRTMNTFHVRTRERTVRWELLFAESDCYDPARITESERTLRELPYILDAGVDAEPHPDGGYRVLVRTRDSWAASAGAAFSFDNGVTLTGIKASAKNILGTGTRGSLFRTSFRERKRTGVLVRQPNFLGTRVDATLSGGQTQPDRFWLFSFLRPYAGELGRTAFVQTYSRRDDYFSYSAGPERPYTQAYTRVDAKRVTAQLQRRFGRPGGVRLVTGVGFTRSSLEVRGESGFLAVFDDNFDDPTEGEPGVAELLGGQATPFDVDRFFVSLGLRKLRFDERRGVDALSALQDVPMGAELLLTAAPVVNDRAGVDPGPWWGLRGTAAWGGRALYGHVDADLEGLHGRTGSSDVLYETRLHGYWTQSERASLALRASWAGGHANRHPFQLTLGGMEGVRGYVADAFPGARRILMTLEQRTSAFGVDGGLAELGLVFFADAGRIWAGDVPLGESSGWRMSAGAGLRLGLPKGSQDVLRIDWNVPVTAASGRGAAFRIYAEIFGLLDRRAWPSQMQRSRWSGPDTDLTRRPRDPLAGS